MIFWFLKIIFETFIACANQNKLESGNKVANYYYLSVLPKNEVESNNNIY